MEPIEPTQVPSDIQLTRGVDGWSGRNEHFRVVGNIIKIKTSDGDINIVPTAQQRSKMYDEFGNYSQHVRLDSSDHIFRLWMNKIGPYLADWVLDKRNDPTSFILPWKLVDFPEGYTLWVHLTGDSTDPANPRTDAYLYGSREHKIFRSPMEFVEHAIWLMKGCVSPCLCKYCTPGQSQRAINRRLNRGQDIDDDNDGGGGGSDGAAVVATTAAENALRHPIFRNRRGAGATAAANASARARQERRAARGERPSMVIMAKDYRVGGNDGGSGSGGTAT